MDEFAPELRSYSAAAAAVAADRLSVGLTVDYLLLLVEPLAGRFARKCCSRTLILLNINWTIPHPRLEVASTLIGVLLRPRPVVAAADFAVLYSSRYR